MSLSLPAAIARLVLVLLATAGCHVGLTSPQPRPSVSEQKPYNSSTLLEVILCSPWTPIVGKLAIWTVASQECLVVFNAILTGFTAHNEAVGGSPSFLFALGTSLAVFGSVVRWISYRTLGRHFTFQLSIKKNHTLVTDGPYAVVRHPGYTGFLLMVAGMLTWFLCEGSWVRVQLQTLSPSGTLCFVLFTAVVGSVATGIMKRLPVEDSTLHVHFKKEWESWAATTRWKLLPGVY